MRIIIGAAATLVLSAMLSGVGPGSAHAQGGSYTSSCRNISSNGGSLSAECRDSTGRYRQTTIQASQCNGDIGNNNGVLSCSGAAGTVGSYVADDRNRGHSSGDRNSGYGGYGNDRYRDNGYGGNDRYGGNSYGRNDRYSGDSRGGGSGYGRNRYSNDTSVGGSYRSSCRNISVRNGQLSADCADSRGRYRSSSLPYSQCRGDIGNTDGMLACSGASASGGNWVR